MPRIESSIQTSQKLTSINLRQWRDADLDPLAEMNADPEVMRFFPKPLTKTESQEMLERMRTAIAGRGWGFWAVEADGVFAGFNGLWTPRFTAHFTPCVEIGWRLRREYWGRGIGYASALAAESFAFEQLKLPELVTFTATINLRSRRLMERLGFVYNERDDFVHPLVAPDSPLHAHVLYRKAAGAFRPTFTVDNPCPARFSL